MYEDAEARARYRDDYDDREGIDGVMTGRQLMARFAELDSFCVSPALQFVRRGFLEESGIRFYEGIVHEDNLFTCLMLAAAPRAAFLNEPLYVRRVRAGSTMTEAREMRHVYGHFKAAYELEAWLRAHAGECSEEFVRALVRHVAFCYDRAAFDALSFDEARLDACAAGPCARGRGILPAARNGACARNRGNFAKSTWNRRPTESVVLSWLCLVGSKSVRPLGALPKRKEWFW